eukprot:TRINITY_DN5068_c0_g1_i1.p1 TRINITY_DN5068_c0_g1~~TRINITY_DN5068_c0_g1_i1.p1  ORF type:complete len:238 (+),score=47.31 TRINITY_DN5068_c0_g1_i1:56-769(+)
MREFGGLPLPVPRVSYTAPLPASSAAVTGEAVGSNGFDNMSGIRTQQAQGMTQGMPTFFPTFLNDIIGNEKVTWTGCYEEGDEDADECDRTQVLPELDGFRDCPFISIALNGEQLKLPLSATDTTQDTHDFAVTPSMDPFPHHRFFSIHISMLIPFDTEKDEAWNSYEYDVTADFINETSGQARTYFLGTLKGGMQPAPIVTEKALFKPTKVCVYRWERGGSSMLCKHVHPLFFKLN